MLHRAFAQTALQSSPEVFARSKPEQRLLVAGLQRSGPPPPPFDSAGEVESGRPAPRPRETWSATVSAWTLVHKKTVTTRLRVDPRPRKTWVATVSGWTHVHKKPGGDRLPPGETAPPARDQPVVGVPAGGGGGGVRLPGAGRASPGEVVDHLDVRRRERGRRGRHRRRRRCGTRGRSRRGRRSAVRLRLRYTSPGGRLWRHQAAPRSPPRSTPPGSSPRRTSRDKSRLRPSAVSAATGQGFAEKPPPRGLDHSSPKRNDPARRETAIADESPPLEVASPPLEVASPPFADASPPFVAVPPVPRSGHPRCKPAQELLES